MRHCVITILLLSLLIAPTSLLVAPARAQSVPQLTQGVVAGGGGVSAQGPLRVEGTVGQGVVATSSGGVFSLDGGFDLTFQAVNAPPTANAQSVTADENTPLAITLTGTDEETPAGSLVFTLTTQPAHGTLSGTAPSLTYTAAGGYIGPDSFKFTVTDTGDGTAPPLTSAEATVSINVVALPTVSARDARVAEPTSGQAQMLFTLTLSRVPTSPVSVAFNTSAAPAGAGAATAGSDYDTTGGTATFQPGQRVQVVAVPVLHDNVVEPDETFLLQLSNASGAHLDDAEATGTITLNTPGTVLITELRTSGPGGAGDDYVEVYNNSDTPLTVSPTGWALVATNGGCAADPVVVGVIPNNTIIPARGHYLFVGSQYSLAAVAAGDQTMTADLASDANVAIFSVADLVNISSASRLDGVGFGTNVSSLCSLMREGATLPTASGSTQQHAFVREFTLVSTDVPTPTDGNDNAADFTVVSTTAATPVSAAITAPTLGAPGPQNRTASPNLKKYSQVGVAYLDPAAPTQFTPNRVRKACAATPLCNPTTANLGTMELRRTFTNNTGGPISQLRFRVYDITGSPIMTPGDADMRLLSAPQVVGVTGPTIGTVTVEATTLDGPSQTNGGGLNSSVTAGIVTLGNQLQNGASIHVNFMLGVQQTGNYRVFVIVEALP